MRWLVDGRGTCWPAGSGSGMTLADLLGHGSFVVEYLCQQSVAGGVRLLGRVLAPEQRQHW